ncbi:MAG: hypothetical protein JXR65_07040 [Bacteroidales bacterium]|nr:hypothetical protein [Bacteroidales bacterium]
MNLTAEQINRAFESFNNKRVMVIGDVMLDAYVWGKVDRISPEAPVPVVAVQSQENRLGGAGNVGLNLQSLGAQTLMCSVIGDDVNGRELKEIMVASGMNVDGIVETPDRVTTTKFRIVGNKVQMLRVDKETTEALNDALLQALIQKIDSVLEHQQVDVIIFQDYDKGVISPGLIDFVVERAKAGNIPVMVDPKKKNFLSYKGVTLMKPNLKEMVEGLNLMVKADQQESLHLASKTLLEHLDAEMVLNTLSERGVYILWKENGSLKDELIPAHIRNIADVSGAGDTVISVAALCMASGLKPAETAFLSNLAGGLVCEEVGVVPVQKDKLLKEALSLIAQ